MTRFIAFLMNDVAMVWASFGKQSCRAKESVLSIKHNQIVNLTTSANGGCVEKLVYDYDFKTDRMRNNLPPGLESPPFQSNLPPPGINLMPNMNTSLSSPPSTSLPAEPRTFGPSNSEKGTTVIFCSSNRTFSSQRERWWYIAVSNCDSRKGLRLKYRIVMVNDQAPGSWIKHFSADQMCKYL